MKKIVSLIVMLMAIFSIGCSKKEENPKNNYVPEDVNGYSIKQEIEKPTDKEYWGEITEDNAVQLLRDEMTGNFQILLDDETDSHYNLQVLFLNTGNVYDYAVSKENGQVFERNGKKLKELGNLPSDAFKEAEIDPEIFTDQDAFANASAYFQDFYEVSIYIKGDNSIEKNGIKMKEITVQFDPNGKEYTFFVGNDEVVYEKQHGKFVPASKDMYDYEF